MPNQITVLSGKVAIVTGGGLKDNGSLAGFGPEIALCLARAGAKVAVIDLKLEDAQHTLKQINSAGGEGLALAADISDVPNCKQLIQTVAKEFGRLDILVNNAGLCKETPFLEITEDEWDRLSNVNGKGAFFASQEALRVMVENTKTNKQSGGVIVFIASDAARKGAQVASAAYTYSKAGMIGVMKSLARTGSAHGVRSVGILPGPGRTEMTKSWPEERRAGLVSQMLTKRLIEPSEIARTVLYAVDPEMHSLTGCCLDVNAGLWIG